MGGSDNETTNGHNAAHPSECPLSPELEVFKPSQPEKAGERIFEIARMDAADRPTVLEKNADPDHPDNKEIAALGLDPSKMRDGTRIHLHYWDHGEEGNVTDYHIMIPPAFMIELGLERAKCFESAPKPTPPDKWYVLDPRYDQWCSNDITPVKFFHYRLGDYIFGHCY